MLSSGWRPEATLGQLGALLPVESTLLGLRDPTREADLSSLGQAFKGLALLSRIQTAASGFLLAGAIGLLLRRKWGWYLTVLTLSASVLAGLVWAMPVLSQLVCLLDSDSGTLSAVLIVIASIPAVTIVALLMLRSVVEQLR